MQHGEEISDDQMKAMDGDTLCSYLKQNSITAACQNDCFTKFMG